MRLAKITCILFLSLQLGYAQNNTQEVATTMLTVESLITYAADRFPAEEPQQLYVLIETQAGGVSTDARFFIDHGMRLLLKRLAPTDLIAIGTYGYDNQMILDFTEASNSEDILSTMTQLYTMEAVNDESDGIDLAYQFANENYEEDYENRVLILRDNSNATNGKVANSKKLRKQEAASKEASSISPNTKLGGAIALTALSILPEILDIIKN
tara:strand:- start:481 stop:1116 length:636 start_codon:yes stop_codon:yes gene_type:complete